MLSLIAADHERMRLLRIAQALGLPDCWIGAGFVRNAAWDHLHGYSPSLSMGDVDVVWFDGTRASPDGDRALEARLISIEPAVEWSVANQARMHARNGDAPYASTEDALQHWPETATAVAVRLADDGLQILAPFGLDDLFALVVRPTPSFAADRLAIVRMRVGEKRWLERWPRLRLASILHNSESTLSEQQHDS